jgi:hypothetical protein
LLTITIAVGLALAAFAIGLVLGMSIAWSSAIRALERAIQLNVPAIFGRRAYKVGRMS